MPTLVEWERYLGSAEGCRGVRSFRLADLLLLAVVREIAPQLGSSLAEFTFGLKRLAHALSAHPDVARLSESSVVIARDFAQICELREGHVRCERGDILVVPLRPLLADFRDQAFA